MWFFLVFFGLGLILTIAGFAIDIPLLNLVGTIMIFTVGLGLLQDGLDVPSGTEQVYVYGNNFTGYHWDDYNGSSDAPSQSDREAFLFHINESNIYDHYDDAGSNRFGWLLMAMGALGFCLSLFRL